MTGRLSFERFFADERGMTVKTAKKAGYHSYPCPCTRERERCSAKCRGWQAVGIPPNGEGESVILGICRLGVARSEILPFGEGA